LSGQRSVQGPQGRLRRTDAAIELTLAAQAREVRAQVRLGEAPEVALAAPTRPLRHQRQREHLAHPLIVQRPLFRPRRRPSELNVGEAFLKPQSGF
jgi:hypothetical protein